MRWERGKPYLCPAHREREGSRAGTGRQGFGGSGVPLSRVAHRGAALTADRLFTSRQKASAFRAGSCDFEAFWDAYGYRRGKAEAADMWLAATRKAPELVPVIIRAASAAAAEHEELAARVRQDTHVRRELAAGAAVGGF